MARRVSSRHPTRAATPSGDEAKQEEPRRSLRPDEAAGSETWTLGARLPAKRFARDDGGALLILTGVLLVLGFVIIGTTLVQLNTNEDKSARNQKETLLESVDGLVGSFSNSVASAIEVGETDLVQFEDTSKAHAALLRDTATRTGLYANLSLHPNPPVATFAGPDKCEVYDPDQSAGGIIIGYERDTFRETIVGAVYEMEFTDGRQTVTMNYYVKIHECTGGTLLSFPNGRTEVLGLGPLPLDPLENADDDRKNVTFVEEGSGDTLYEDERAHDAAGNEMDAVTNIRDPLLGWSSTSEENIARDDNQWANRPSPPAADLLQFNLNPWQDLTDVHNQPGGVVINDLQLTVDAKENVVNALLGDNDYLQLKAYRDGELLPYWYHNFTFAANNVEERFSLTPPTPSGNPEWTYEEFTDTLFEFSVIAEGLKDGDHTFHVDWVSPIIDYTGFQGYRLEMEFQWDDIPPIYTDHELSAVYRVKPTTTAEQFQFQLFDPVATTWDDFGPPLIDSGAWETWGPEPIPAKYHNGNDPLLRLVDKLKTDKALDDRSNVEMDHLVIASIVDP